MTKVSKLVTLKCVALVKPLGLFCSLPYLVCVGWVLYALWPKRMSLGGACVLSVLFAPSCVLRVSFVCSLALVHVFRGSLWVFCFCALLPVVSTPFCLPSRSWPFLSFVRGWFPELVLKLPCGICITFLLCILAFCISHVSWCIGIFVSSVVHWILYHMHFCKKDSLIFIVHYDMLWMTLCASLVWYG
jgi:hypothetical protein